MQAWYVIAVFACDGCVTVAVVSHRRCTVSIKAGLLGGWVMTARGSLAPEGGVLSKKSYRW
jgi:hypothetical protein